MVGIMPGHCFSTSLRASITPLQPMRHGLSSVKVTSPVLAPPAHVAFILPVGQTALAARTHCSHRPLEMLIVAPLSTALSENCADPDFPVVDVGAPPHFVMAPAMPPHMASSATFSSWKTIFLRVWSVRMACLGHGASRGANLLAGV